MSCIYKTLALSKVLAKGKERTPLGTIEAEGGFVSRLPGVGGWSHVLEEQKSGSLGAPHLLHLRHQHLLPAKCLPLLP